MRIALLIAALALPLAAQAQPVPDDLDYGVGALDPALLVDPGDAIIRVDARSFHVDAPGRATEKVHFAATVFEESGRGVGTRSVGYDDRLRRLKSFRGALYDASGERVRKLGKDDWLDVSAYGGARDFSRNRVRTGTLVHDRYPYTVEFTWEVAYDGVAGWPAFFPQDTRGAVEYAALEVEAPLSVPFDFQTFHAELEPTFDRTDRNRRTVRWEARAQPETPRETWAAPFLEWAPHVWIAPHAFEVEGARADLRSWQSYGQWYHDLQTDRDRLSDATLARIASVTAGLPTPAEKARALYQMMQDRTRYVSVQLGLGGWQSFPAEYVEERGYGDCKALTNYLVSLLRAADVEAYPVLIRAGRRAAPMHLDLVSNQFNHVIAAVPLPATAEAPADTLWLEATSQTQPFGWLGEFTSDRPALLVKDGASHLVRTPRMHPEQNGQHRTADVTLAADGSAEIALVDRYSGAQKDRMHDALHQRTAQEQLETLSQTYALPSYEVVAHDAAALTTRDVEAAMTARLRAVSYGRSVGSRLFVPLSPLSQLDYALEDAQRELPVDMGYAFVDTDTVRIALPEGYTVEALPSPVTHQTDFARYAADVQQQDGALVYARRLELTDERLPAERYSELRAFFQTVARADGAQAVLKRP